MRFWEINGNLYSEQTGIKNIELFERAIIKTKCVFDNIFGQENMNRVPFYVDNATADSGYTPICTPVLRKVVVIKLGIYSNDDEAKVAYQFAHELTHVVFWGQFGFDKPPANDDEEAICTAAALSIVRMLYPNRFEAFKRSAMGHIYLGYRKGAELAEELSYELTRIKACIESFQYECCTQQAFA